MIRKSSSWVLFNFVKLICRSSVFPSCCPFKEEGDNRQAGAFGAGPPACFPHSVHKVAGQALGFGQPGVRTTGSAQRPGSSLKRCEGPRVLQGLGVPGRGGGVPVEPG